MLKVFIVDDEPVIIETLKAYFERDDFLVEYADNGADGLYKIIETKPDMVILDLMLPDISGEEICLEIRRTLNVPIIMLTAKTAEDDRINGIEIGADDYIVKPFSPREVVTRAKGILRRMHRIQDSNDMTFNDSSLVIKKENKEVIIRGNSIILTPIEFNLLTEMANNPGSVYTRTQLLNVIQEDNSFEGYERGIDVHIKNLRKKIELDTKNPNFIITIFGIGYKFGGNPDV